MTTPTGSERFVVDSTGWVEYLGDGPKAHAFAEYLDKPESVLLPVIVVYEVYKKLLRERKSDVAASFLSQAFGFDERIVPIDIRLAALAAKTSIDMRLAMADATIYATAKMHRAQLITSDMHFSGLDYVTLV